MSAKRFDMDEFLKSGGKNTERTISEHKENTKRTRFKDYEKSKYNTFSIRLTPQDKERLQRYFEDRDIPLSQGLRMIIKDWMERQGI